MKRIGFLYEQIYSLENLQCADQIAQKGKARQYGVIQHKKNQEANIQALHETLKGRTYKTSEYTVFKVYEPKEREVFRLPYYPDRIVHHAIMNVLEPILLANFTADTYACIKGKGIHAAVRNFGKALKDVPGTQYCLQMDIRKFYPSVDHAVLKYRLRRKFKDADLLRLLDEIIDSAPGLPIGNYLSQHLANFYLSGLDHWLKEVKKVKYYFRYADDMVILGATKQELHSLRADIREYLSTHLNLSMKATYQVFPVAARGIDVLGYRFYHTHVLLRKSIKKRFARAVAKGKGQPTIAAYLGWAKHCNSKHLVKKLLTVKSFSELGITTDLLSFEGEKIKIRKLLDREIIVHDYRIVESKYTDKGNGKRLDLQIEIDGVKRVTWTGSIVLMDQIQKVSKDDLPIKTTIIEVHEAFKFS